MYHAPKSRDKRMNGDKCRKVYEWTRLLFLIQLCQEPVQAGPRSLLGLLGGYPGSLLAPLLNLDGNL